ncbi:MAG: helix-turn-helix domain-containing protein [Bacteroidia bacterium]
MKYVREEKFLKILGKRIRVFRMNQGITQAQLAFEAEIPRMQVSRIERGELNTGISTLIRIAKVLDVSTKDLIEF